ncbi:nuclear pore complex protein Nup153-like isoform X2 [Polyodon spathula]|uniref:nuclear pore complex protein Nup153-like isoform X2 n=1 Tax=Polyodon spathula TaxID=7913 RepID=UPI001B7DAB95|nr:nuclear pore complex protein Nup153-like isoform X2 [Polyodon spathula]
MADAGGGKIRTRRYHIASKPYAKGKQQGIIGRVTDTVKNIVPGWLQKYFKSNEPTSAEGDVEEEADGRENHDIQIQNNQGHTEEEVLPFSDRRHTPEPSTSNAEPSTSQSALNLSILPRPPLNRSHNFATLNSPSLHCQPSTSAAFPIGSSGFSLIKEIKDSTSQHEDDNISTTSGFSSRASDKDVTTSKNMFVLPVWSPEADRSQSVPQQAGTSLRKPAFNLSVFGGSSTSLASTSALNSSQLGDSMFYPGKTTYGGAAAVRSPSSRVRGTPYQAPVRRQIKAKQIHSPCGVTSATARRILQSLERMSSPLADAKRIPSPSSLPLSPMLNRGELEVTHFKSKRKSDAQHPPVQKLVTPKAASVAVNKSMFFKPSLTPTGHSSSSADRGGRQTKHVEPEISLQHPKSTSSFSYPLFSTPAANGMDSGGAGGKMKRERGIRASSKPAQDQEEVEIPNLPHISLPVRISTLPTLNFCCPTNTSPSVTTTPVANKVPPAASIQNRTGFTFSSPIFKATETSPLPLTPSAGFTFSAPVPKTVASDLSETTSTPSATPVKNSSTSSSAVGTPVNTNDEDFEGPFRPAKALKQGSVLDILKGPDFSSSPAGSTAVPVKPFQMTSTSSPTGGFGFGDKFKPATGSWQCDACLLQNKPSDSKCVACQTAKPNVDSSKESKCSKTTPETLPSLGDKFKPVSGTWECDTCLVQNKPEVTKCVACETSKPGTGVKSALSLPAFSESKLTVGSGGSGSTSITTMTSSLSSGFGFGEKFKKPEGAWDCDVCLVQNKAEDIKCVSCQCAKPGAVAVPPSGMTAPEPSGGLLDFGDIFKKPEGSWDCDVCAVQNKAEMMQCVACQSAKPGAKVETKGFSSSALSSATTASPFGGITGGFKFGDQGGIKFGTSSTDNAASGGITGGFKFGTTKSEDSQPDSQPIGSGFKFGAAGGIQFGTGNCSSQSENKAAEPKGKPSLEGFCFGLSAPPKADEKTADGGFKFGAPKEKPELGGTAVAVQFSFGKQEEKKHSGEQLPAVGFAFGKPVEEKTGTLAPSAASTFMLGKTDKPDPVSSSSKLLFGKGKESDKPAAQLGFSFGKPETAKQEMKPVFSFGKPAEKQEAAVQPKPTFAFGVAPATADQGASKPAYNFMGSTTASATVTAASTASCTPSTNMFGSSSTSASIVPASTFMFGQASSTGFSSGASETTTCSKSFIFGAQESKAPIAPAAGASPFVFVTGSNTAATAAFGFGSTASAAPTTTSSTGSSASQFVFGSASSTPASAPAFGSNQTTAFCQGSNQPSAPAFGSPAAAALFSAGSQPPAFGSQASTNQPSVFGQQSNQPPAFGAAVAASAVPAGGFQFGAISNFGTPSSSGVFAFGGNAAGSPASAVAPAAPAQPSGSTGGFQFSQGPGFNIGSTKTTTSTGSSQGHHQISGRKIKTAVRRRK